MKDLSKYSDKFRCKEFYGIPLTVASLLLFGDKGAIQGLLFRGAFSDYYTEYIEKKIYKSENSNKNQLFIDRDFFFEFWQRISDQEVIISSYFFKKALKVDKNTFNIIVDKNQRIKGLKGIYYKISYVNKVLKENNLPLI